MKIILPCSVLHRSTSQLGCCLKGEMQKTCCGLAEQDMDVKTRHSRQLRGTDRQRESRRENEIIKTILLRLKKLDPGRRQEQR